MDRVHSVDIMPQYGYTQWRSRKGKLELTWGRRDLFWCICESFNSMSTNGRAASEAAWQRAESWITAMSKSRGEEMTPHDEPADAASCSIADTWLALCLDRCTGSELGPLSAALPDGLRIRP